MAASLVIVESPAKAKTINKYLGSKFIVRSSMGHIRDLPVSASSDGKKKAEPIPKDLSPQEKEKEKERRAYNALVRNMAIDPDDGWKARYEILPGKHKVLSELKKYAKQADTIYLATDLDREGEAIAWHLQEAIGGDRSRYKRVTFSEITKSAIQKAFENPGELNMQRVNAQQTRRFLDRVVGFMLSPLLWKKVARGLSAGRVQSVAVKLIVEREREIRAFVPEEYWEIFADLLHKKHPFQAKVVKYLNKPFRPVNKEQADKAVDTLSNSAYTVLDSKLKPTKQRPPAPFITTTLTQAASTRLGFSIKKTMLLAQRLYEAGHITYMRTDSRQLSPVAVNACRDFINDAFGPKYVPGKPQFYASGKGAQEAHEAIRPTQVNLVPGSIDNIEADQQRLYDLIWRQFVACQMTAAEFDSSTIIIKADDYELRANGRVMRFDGWMRVLPPAKQNEDERELPVVKTGDSLDLEKLHPSQHFTKPPARYTEASLVKELERLGIGRPSTYAPIISTIQDRGYVQLIKRRFYAQKIGDIVTERLDENFDDLMDYGFTASVEEKLDLISVGEQDWRKTLDMFYQHFCEQLKEADSVMRLNEPVPVDYKCSECGRQMVVRTAKTGVFLSCTGYELPPKERCKATVNLVPGDESEAVNADDGETETAELMAKKRCPKCGTAMDSWLVDDQHRLHICGNSPDCDGTVIEKGEYKIKGYEGPVIECEKCGGEMQLRTGRFGKFFACIRYPECKNTRKLMRNGQPAPPMMDPVPMPELKCEKSDAYFLLRDSLAGLFLAAHTFPKSRETRSPLVEEVAKHRQELPEKHHYLADAPQEDPDGNKAVIKWKRKEKIQYLGSVKDGKPTKWAAFYQNNNWKWEKK